LLLAQRLPDTHLAGKWEFPGGKIEDGESAEHALRRELHEELGIDAGAIEPLISVPWSYPGKAIVLHALRVVDFSGDPRGRQGQALRWVDTNDMRQLPMPLADRPIVTALRLPREYAITPEPTHDTAAFLEQIDVVAAAPGMRLLQLRAKALPAHELHALASAAQARVKASGTALLLNGNVDLVRSLDLDGVHLPAAELMRLHERPLGADRWVAASCHDEKELAHAAAIGVDFAVLGPVLPPRSHPGLAALGWAGVYLEPVTLEPSVLRQRYELVGDERVETPVGAFDSTRWRFTALGSYNLPKVGVQVSGTMRSDSGGELAANWAAPNSATVNLNRPFAGVAGNTVTVNLVEPGTLHGDRVNQIDLRFAKILRFGRTRTNVGLDIYNITNSAAVLTYNETFSPTQTTWLTPTSVLQARFVKFSAQIDF